MYFNDLLLKKEIDPRQVLVLRHRPSEPKLNRVFPRLASERPDIFNARVGSSLRNASRYPTSDPSSLRIRRPAISLPGVH